MKGIIFTTFSDMVEEQLGIQTWEILLDTVKPKSGGIYTSVSEYPDSELFSLVEELARQTHAPAEVLVEQFGYYLFGVLDEKYPLFKEQAPDFYSFLCSIDGVIHKEVEKLYSNPSLPVIGVSLENDIIKVDYRSPRKLCLLSLGLIRRAAESYGHQITVEHPVCMHKGADHCELNIHVISHE